MEMKKKLCPVFSVMMVVLAFACASAQTSAVRASWKELAKESTAIVVGTVVGKGEVLRADKSPQGGGIDAGVTLPAADEFRLGTAYYLRITEVVKGNRKIRAGKTVTIFKPGWFYAEGDPKFTLRRRYLIFLRPVEANPEAFATAVIEQPEKTGKANVPFRAESSYSVTFGEDGVVRLTSQNQNVVAKVRSVVRKSR